MASDSSAGAPHIDEDDSVQDLPDGDVGLLHNPLVVLAAMMIGGLLLVTLVVLLFL